MPGTAAWNLTCRNSLLLPGSSQLLAGCGRTATISTRQPRISGRDRSRVKDTVQQLYNQVCDILKIRDDHFLGLSVVQNNEHIFMDLEQKLNKYFPKEWKKETSKNDEKVGSPFVVCLRVQYYVENGKVISDKKARHFYYCQLKEQVLNSSCTSKEEAYFLLTAYALQADMGNYKKNVHTGSYFEPRCYFPEWVIRKRGCEYILKHVPKMHREQRGLTSKEAMLRFIKEACLLEDVPVHYYRLQKDKKEEHPSVVLGLTLKGMHIYQEIHNVRHLLYDFPWSNIGKLTFLGKKFEIQPDGLPSARKLIYYTGCPFRSKHLLQLLSNSHRLYMNIQPVLKQIRKMEETEDKKRYRESYISDTFEMDLGRLDAHSHGSGSSQGSERKKCPSRQSTVSHSSSHTSGIEADSRYRMSAEMAVDEPLSSEAVHSMAQSCSSMISRGSSHTSGIESNNKYRTENNGTDIEEEVPINNLLRIPHSNCLIEGESVDNTLEEEDYQQGIGNELIESLCDPSVKLQGQSVNTLSQASRSKSRNSTDRHSQSLDDVRLYQRQPPLCSTLSSDNSQSYTFGCIYEDKDSQFCYTYSTADCKTKSTFYGKRSMNCLSLDLLGDEQLMEFVV
ncbi:FERM domain-containing protein 6 isoform X3 [Hypanus sabinus]|uniref:FERM domain-containing protein 6 isoform X3 n=1 Tax=Hypanus sabinus TaxID=79690 RepID=UPI0028C3A9E9|nr:FERM domain-containing protein 6 isoform X3 [Hypanus sabinus]